MSDLEELKIPQDLSHIDNARQLLWHLINQIPDIPTCIECDNKVRWRRKNYAKFCSPSCRAKNLEVKNKKQKTMTERYGVTHALQSNHINKKMHDTMKSKYGVAHALQNSEFQKKFKETMVDRFGVEYATQSASLKGKAQETNLNRYGYSNPAQSISVKKKTQETNQKLYQGHHTQKHLSEHTKNILSDKEQLTSLLKENSVFSVAELLGVDQYTIYNRIAYFDIDFSFLYSNFESSVKLYLEQFDIDFICNTRSQIPPLELDFYFPEKHLAIECNGDYWHSEQFKHKKYHYLKWQKCQDNSITLIQLSESMWLQRPDLIKRLIESHLNLKLSGDPARKCQIQQVDARTARPFLDQHHLQGFVGGTSHWGAFDSQDQLVGVMTFGWTRGSKKSRRFELKRWATDNFTHAGLFSKTFKHAQKTLGFSEVVSFSMNDWFTGDVYKKCGFTKGNIFPPAYQYYYKGKLHHCSSFTKSQIAKKLPDIYNANLTEREMMKLANIPRVWDSGKTEWTWKND